MTRLRRIETLANKIVPKYSNMHIFPRGLPFYTDPLLRGEIRFARRTGPTLAVINPDTTYKIVEAARRLTRDITVDRINAWPVLGSILSIGPALEFNIIDDINAPDKKFLLQFDMAGDHPITERVELYAVPILASASSPKGSVQVHVFSVHDMFNGDQLTLLQDPNLLNSLIDVDIELAEFLGVSGNVDFPKSYRLTLKKRLPVEIIQGSTAVCLRANAAYKSKLIQVPNNPLSVIPLGPILVDHISGMLRDEDTINETLSIKALTQGDVPIVGTANAAVTVDKNFPIVQVPVPAEVMLFWDLIKGNLQFDGENKVHMIPEADGQGALFTEIFPAMPPGVKWNIDIISVGADMVLRVKFGPNDYTDYAFNADVQQTITIGTETTDEPITSIEFVLISAGNQTNIIKIGDWRVDGEFVSKIEFNLVAHARGEAQWQSSGLVVKPYFLGLDYVRLRYNNSQFYNGGAMYL